MSVMVYGLDTCDTCKKARNWLGRHNVAHEFVDYRAHPIPAATLKDYAKAVGGWEKLVNRSSMTWRNLPEARKAPAPTLIRAASKKKISTNPSEPTTSGNPASRPS